MARRLVVLGRKKPQYATRTMRVDLNSRDVVAEAGLPQWESGPTPGDPMVSDYDLADKQHAEEALARGDFA